LVADGLTNKQIAARLFISERTAQNHVQHILRRLGYTNRSQIAVWHAIDVSGRDK
jgi:DNA-binding NarL/FixJ family response regulator